jgi:tellurite resistance protein TerB
MSALNWIKAQTEAAKQALEGGVSRFNNRKFMQGAVAFGVMISAADGNISSEEKKKLYGVFNNLDALKAFKWDSVQPLFDELARKYEFDADIGFAEAMKYVAALKGDEASARQLIRIGVMVGGSDGNFDEDEKNVVRKACRELGLNPADFDL